MSKQTTSHSFFYRNGLTIVLLALMAAALGGQYVAGWLVYNQEQADWGQPAISLAAYFFTGHFVQATFENWESEFLQMGLYVLLTVKLRQAGSAESKKLDEPEEVDREPQSGPDAPWPVRKGGLWLRVYSYSLSIAFLLLFIVSMLFHFMGSLKSYNAEQTAQGEPTQGWQEYMGNSQFWFESFQNWQSEFLAVAAIVTLSIFLRQKGSPESKAVDAPHSQTGD